MRTAEEIKAEINRQIEETRCRSCVTGLENVLEFIDSEPPCKHLKLLFWHGKAMCPGDLPSGWYYVRQNNNTASDSFKFCPDCGEELPAEGPA